MRKRYKRLATLLTFSTLAIACPGPGMLGHTPAQAQSLTPEGAKAFTLDVIETPLQMPSGLDWHGNDLIATDLATGRVVEITGGIARNIMTPLPFGMDVMNEPTGPYKVAVYNEKLYITQGWQDVDRGEGPLDHALLARPLLGPDHDVNVISQDFWNPYDLARSDRAWLVVDASKNALVKLEDGARQVEEVFVFPRLERSNGAFESLSPTAFPQGKAYEVDAVPTGIAVHDSRVFVSLFGGFPYVEGGGALVLLNLEENRKTDGKAQGYSVVTSGLNAPIDVEVDASGRLLVLEMGRYDLEKGFLPESGQLLALDRDSGKKEVLAQGLFLPVTLATNPDGRIAIAQMAGPLLILTPRATGKGED